MIDLRHIRNLATKNLELSIIEKYVQIQRAYRPQSLEGRTSSWTSIKHLCTFDLIHGFQFIIYSCFVE
ncbi:hypothetical protein MPTK1_5g10230 [Marchantia polymorpha subsp. ruderalis]|uniref:Uncharacterized protein n=2 Tax=Marchantia polymorpha TaxID=3197 RepID=A0AAF6BGV1_MARPO|nr:hypothetical protein MARPO_0048s0050 [Marchantia polymorpha]BBN11235.1 hypothetical protein Mp_5g10230 [Marchantia polymorpha subsp. ruderalis]|eukprot:PTQ38936.1 hypothetical protein MARPO_0048s0050 [Marchantia polymorpha]